MAEILKFIKTCEDEGIRAFLESHSAWPDIEMSRQFLLTLEEEESARVYAALHGILQSLHDYQSTLLREKTEIREGMLRDARSRNACLTYLDHARKLGIQMNTKRK